MPKLPVCPHCNTIYRYRDVRRIMNEKSEVCYHCKKSFEIKRKKLWILILIIALICAIFDVFELYMVAQTNFITLVVTNVPFICIGLIFRPFYIKFVKTEKSKL